MKTFQFDNGDQMPLLGLGTWKSSPGKVYSAVKEAVRAGYRHIDCAAIYKNEKEVGQAVADLVADGIVRREDLWITSKLWNDSHRKEDVLPALKKSLTDLQLEYLDLYLMHWPVALRKGIDFPRKPEDYLSLEEVPLLETWEALAAVKQAGMIRHLGVSNFNIPKLKFFLENSPVKPEMNQVEMHPYLIQKDLVDFAHSEGIRLTAYSPLGSGDRPTAQRDQLPVLLENEVVREVAGRRNASPAQILIAFQLHRNIAVIPKSVHPGRIRENLEAGRVSLTEEDVQMLEELDEGLRYLDGWVWTREGSPYTYESLWIE